MAGTGRGERPDLAPYAARSAQSRGRAHEEPFKDDRPAFERDRDRIIHCEAFRKLEYKTQVFLNHEGDYYRTRLTHSLEVAQISRGLARRLGLNEELAEALALAHDLGHTPFGHTGEEVLHRLASDEGGFEHNLQGLRVVTRLEERYPGFPGLNLTWEVREGIVKHASSWDRPLTEGLDEYELPLQPTLEAQLIDLADEIAYNNHDIDDGLEAGYITLDELDGVEVWRETRARVRRKFPGISGRREIYQTISHLIGRMMSDVVEATTRELTEAGVETLDDVRRAGRRLVVRSPEMERRNRELKEFLYQRLYRHPKVEAMRVKAERFLTELFHAYVDNRGLLSRVDQERAEREGLKRVVCDRIAGMTDRSCLEEYRRLFDPFQKV
ncbi:deoxyguanosinetriphosphate triphosphohydrolase [Deferrisoma camini]|uniref:deoxyguanosinetriphosphate triphosphohydrolase n=1 Tax=Deferrisoma camini TaxID=1035120 RepID=UPI00046CC6CC|nr:deoxyguanosinetriphosphate triphosphohydrolase [Deferrisoma camini]